jgi:O-antigen ligase
MEIRQRLNFIPWQEVAFFALCGLWASLTFSTALAEISFVTLVIAWVFCWNKSNKPTFSTLIPKSVWIPLAFFAAFILISLVFSEYPKESARGVWKSSKQILVFLMTAQTLSSAALRVRFEKFFLIFFFIICLDGYCQYFLGWDFLRGKPPELSGAGLRIGASFGTYGKFASYLILTIPYLLLLGLSYRRQKAWSWWYIAFMSFAGAIVLLVLTRSRGAMLAVCLGSGLALLLRRQFLILIFLAALAFGFYRILPENMVIHLDSERKEQSVIERFHLWERAIDVIKAKPVTGTGINTYTKSHAKYDTQKSWRVRNYYAHNGLLQMGAEIGLPGVLCFVIFLAAIFFHALNRLSGGSGIVWGLCAGLWNFLALALVDTVLHNPQPVLQCWFMLGLLLAYLNSRDSQTPKI